MTNPMSNPTPMSIVITTTVPEEMNNTTIAVASPSDVGTTSKMQSAPSMNTTTDLSVIQDMACTFKAFSREKETILFSHTQVNIHGRLEKKDKIKPCLEQCCSHQL